VSTHHLVLGHYGDVDCPLCDARSLDGGPQAGETCAEDNQIMSQNVRHCTASCRKRQGRTIGCGTEARRLQTAL